MFTYNTVNNGVTQTTSNVTKSFLIETNPSTERPACNTITLNKQKITTHFGTILINRYCSVRYYLKVRFLETEKDMSRCQLHLAAYNGKHICHSRIQSLTAFLMSGIKRRYLIQCERYISGITLISYAHNRNIGEPNNLKCFGRK